MGRQSLRGSSGVRHDQRIIYENLRRRFFVHAFTTWGEGSPVAVIVDPFTAKKSGKIEIPVSLMGDVGVLREEFDAISTDSAIQ
jgi:hypothetical protein